MDLPLIVINIICFIYVALAYESPEVNKIEVNPIYDTIVFSDIADIMNDFENNINPELDPFPGSDSESDENIDDLLAEYQHYLDKAHKQSKSYIEKSKTKNKVPLVRHERYTKTKPSISGTYEDFYPNGYYNTNDFKVPRIPYNSPFDLFIPFNAKARYFNKPEFSSPLKGIHDAETFENIMHQQKLADLPTVLKNTISQPIKSLCYCKDNKLPCECDCKQCLISLDATSRNNMGLGRVMPNDEAKNGYGNDPFTLDYSVKNPFKTDEKSGDNVLNIRIKVDVQLPKVLENMDNPYRAPNRENTLEHEESNPKEFISTLHLPTSYYNFPLPMELLGFTKTTKYSKHESSPMHKVTIHKKKKAKTNNNNKKHRKKVITFHNIKLEPHQILPVRFEINTTTQNRNLSSNTANKMVAATAIQPNVTIIQYNNVTTNQSNVATVNRTQTEESIYLSVNISSSDHLTDDFHKMENSIETEYKHPPNVTTPEPKLRKKREIKPLANIALLVNDSLSQMKHILNITKSFRDKNNNTDKPEKAQLLNTELLFWPNITKNESRPASKNITAILLEREVKRTKLNVSRETLRKNHTRALEQAIFGEVDWDDIDSVAPAFMSFVGKYLRGMLTFCNQSVCHSMKCADKACVHRTCLADNRLNKRGHCAGSNDSDSVASMESVMDLPSNIAFEVVDILEERMLGKLFGKVTLCISSKCISFVASKKVFQKNKCSLKELNSTGHCPNIKNVKSL